MVVKCKTRNCEKGLIYPSTLNNTANRWLSNINTGVSTQLILCYHCLVVCFILKAPPCKHGRSAGFAVQGTWAQTPQKHPRDWEKEQVKDSKNMQNVGTAAADVKTAAAAFP